MAGGRIFLLFFVLAVSIAHAALPLDRTRAFELLHDTGATAPSLVRLYLLPTGPVKLDWDTPRRLLLTALEGTVLNWSHPIGHVSVEIQLAGQDGSERHVFTGATDRDAGASRKLLLKEELAFSILERAWPGVLEDAAGVNASIAKRAQKRGRLAVVTFLISDESCLRLLEYVRALRARGGPLYYGFTARPRRAEGSGCSAFGASFVDLIGMLGPPLRAAWSRSVRVPLSLMAGYLGQPRLSIARALVHKAVGRWAAPQDPHMLLECFDPDLMFAWAMARHAEPGDWNGIAVQQDLELPKLLDQRLGLDGAAQRNVKAVLVDARDVPTPQAPIFDGPPALLNLTDTEYPTVIRSDKVVAPNGSFELKP